MQRKSLKSLKKIFKTINKDDNLSKLLSFENEIKTNLAEENWKMKIDKNNNIILKKNFLDNRMKIIAQKTHFNSRFEKEEEIKDKKENEEEEEEEDRKNIIFRNINFTLKINNKDNKIILNTDSNEGGLLINNIYFNEENFYKGPKFDDLDDFLQILLNRYFYEFGISKEFIGNLELLSTVEYFKDMDKFNRDFYCFLS